jgi:predicted flap endonuclease-1-like 5' DNA nuclease
MTLAALTFHWGTWIAAIVAFLLGWLITWFFGNRGKQHEEVLRRVVETSTDESTRLKTLSDEHHGALKLKDDALLRIKGDHENELVALKTDRDKALAVVKERDLEVNTHKAEATKLQGLVGTVDTSKKEIDDLRGQLNKQKADYEVTVGDWRKRAESGEAAKAAAEKRVADVQADHTRVIGEWQTKVTAADAAKGAAEQKVSAVEAAKAAAEKRVADVQAEHAKVAADHSRVVGEWQSKASAAESKATEVHGLLGSTKADNERVVVEWRTRAEKAEGELGNWSRRYAELETGNKKSAADHEAAVGEWRSKVTAADAAKVAAEKRVADVQAEHAKVAADHTRVVGDWQSKASAAESKATEVQGLLGSAKADNDKVLTEWRARAEKAEGELGNWSRRYAELETGNKKFAADHEAALGEWRSKVSAADAAKVAAEKRIVETQAEQSRVAADHSRVVGEWQSKASAAEQKATEVHGLLGSAKADNDKALTEWRARAEKAETDLGNWSRRYSELEASTSKSGADHERVLGDWRKRAETSEASVAEATKRSTEWDTKYKSLESTHAGCAASLAASQAKHTEVQGLLGSRDTELSSLKGKLAEVTAGPDDLLVIEGIGPKINQALRADGLTRWVHVRDASQDRLKSAIEKAGITFAPSMTTWPKQAAYLVDGDQAGFKQYTEFLISGQDPTAYGAEVVIGTKEVEALASGAVYGSGNVEVAAVAKNKDGGDNLMLVEGIGPKFNAALNTAGIDTFNKLAASSEPQLRAAIQAAGLNFAPSITTWAEQAGLLAKGDMVAFKALTDRLVAGRG